MLEVAQLSISNLLTLPGSVESREGRYLHVSAASHPEPGSVAGQAFPSW
jgi:hypothetical protein